jgi:transcriptional regulator with XRE-family HTH domain
MRQDLKNIRESLGLSQAMLAVKADVSPSIVWQLENGRRKRVSPRIAHKLAAVYGITAEQVNGGALRPASTAA